MVFGLMVLSFGLSLAAAEVLVRWVAPQQLILLRPDIWQPVPALGWAHRPGADTQVNTGERTVRWVTDHRGFRTSPEGPVSSDRAVLLLGDSFMAALQVEYRQSFAGLMEAYLTDHSNTPVAVHNSSVGGWDPPHYLIAAKQLLAEEDYDLVLVAVYLGNDIVPRRIEEFPERRPVEWARPRLPQALNSRELIESLARPVNDYLKQHSHLFMLVRHSFDSALMRVGISERYIPWGVQRENADHDAWDVTAGILQDIATLAEQRGTPTIFVLVPSLHQVDRDALDRHARALGFDLNRLDPDQPTRALKSLLHERGLSVVDPLQVFRSQHECGVELYGSVDPHLSPDGHRVLWNVVEPEAAQAVGIREEVLRSSRNAGHVGCAL